MLCLVKNITMAVELGGYVEQTDSIEEDIRVVLEIIMNNNQV